MKIARIAKLAACLLPAALAFAGCNTIDSDRIPAYPVNINLTPHATWQTYGVVGFGDTRRFVRELKEPANFAWLANTRTGYGGILLVCGIDPFTTEANVPMAFDLSCPVERSSTIRVAMVSAEPLPVAECPVCHSRYDVIEAGGRPISGPAKDKNYGLRIYQCIPPASNIGGYLITN